MNSEQFTNYTEALAFKNAKIKRFPNDSYKIICFSRPVYRDGERNASQLEAEKDYKRYKEQIFINNHLELIEQNESKKNESITRADNLRRAKNRIFEIAMTNKWDYFVTLTVDGSKADRYNAQELSKPVSKWLQNMVQRRDIRYLLCPELHKDGAIHFHGLISEGLNLTDSGTVRVQGHKKPLKISTAKSYGIKSADMQTVFNIKDYKLGFSSAIRTDENREAISGYMTKYITKDMQKIFGNFYFAGGKGLKREAPASTLNLDFNIIPEKEWELPQNLGSVKYVTLPSKEALHDFLTACVVDLEELQRSKVVNLVG